MYSLHMQYLTGALWDNLFMAISGLKISENNPVT